MKDALLTYIIILNLYKPLNEGGAVFNPCCIDEVQKVPFSLLELLTTVLYCLPTMCQKLS